MVAIAEVESNWNVNAVGYNLNGTIDRGLMQLNSSWFNHSGWADPEINVTAAAKHISFLREYCSSWYQVVIVYNCGLNRLNNPPDQSITYAVKVFNTWAQYDRSFVNYVGK
jgi:soluble lytic murein transglycosylase-like protein